MRRICGIRVHAIMRFFGPQKGMSALHNAALSGSAEMVEALINAEQRIKMKKKALLPNIDLQEVSW